MKPPIFSDTDRSKPQRPWWYLFLGLLLTMISLGIMGKLVYDNIDPLLEVQKQINIWPIATTFPIFLIALILAAVAWSFMMNDLVTDLPMAKHFRIFIITHAARRLPGTLWYVIGRVAWYEQLGVTKRRTTFISILESVLIILAGLVIALLTFPLLVNIEKNLLILFGVGIVLSAMLVHPSVLDRILKRLKVADSASHLSFGSIAKWLIFYIVIWIMGGTMLFLILQAFAPQNLSMWPISIGAWSIAGVSGLLIQILPSGLGVTEATMSLILSAFISPSIAVSAAILLRILMTFYEFSIALLVFWLSDKEKY